jgi:hypothetical protein
LTEKPLVRVCSSWQGKQLAFRIGSTLSLKGSAAPAGLIRLMHSSKVMKPSEKMDISGTFPLL